MKVSLYTRVSSDRQDVDLSISAQLKALREYATSKGYTVFREFADEAESGRTAQRPVFQEMIAVAKRKQPPFEAILVWKLSRFARNREDSIVYKSLLRKHGVQVISINEPMDNSPTGRMMEGVIEVLDEFYSANLAQEVTRGMREAVGRGFWVSARTPYGYRRTHVMDGTKQRAKLESDPAAAQVIRRIFEQAAAGIGAKEITKALNAEGIPSPKGKKWGRGHIHNVLTRSFYTGTLTWGSEGKYHREAGLTPLVVRDALPALVDEATFQLVQRSLRARAPNVTHPRRVASPYLLSGLLRCSHCGAAMFGVSTKQGQFRYYTCATAFRNGRRECPGKSVPQELIEGVVLDKVRELVLQEERLSDLVRFTNEELAGSLQGVRERMAAQDAQLGDLERRLERLYDALETGKLSLEDLAPRIKELRSQRDLLARAKGETRETLDAGQVELVDRKALLGYLGALRAVLELGTVAERRAILKSFVQDVVKGDAEITVSYTLPLPPAKVAVREPVINTVPYGGAWWTVLELAAAQPQAQAKGTPGWLGTSFRVASGTITTPSRTYSGFSRAMHSHCTE